jgi:hypothetical protein
MTELIKARMAITDATLDTEKMDEREANYMRKELDHI